MSAANRAAEIERLCDAVHLLDNAERSAIQARRQSVQTTLIRLLIHDEYE